MTNIEQQTIDTMKTTGDVLSIGTVIATIAGWLPAIAALFAIAWSIMQIVINWDKFKAVFSKKKDS